MTPSGSELSSSCSSVPSAWSAANRRPSESMQDSSAATQITPGAIERNRSGSAPLTLRQSLHREIGQFEQIEGLLYLPRRDAKPGEGAGDAQILRGGEVVLHRGCVADVDQLLRVLIAQAPDFRSLPAHRAGGRRQQSAENTQEARLAAAVGPGDAQKLAAAQRDRQVAEQAPAAALARQIDSL